MDTIPPSHHLQLFQKKNLPSLISIFLIFEFSSHTNEPHNNTTTHILSTHKHIEFQSKNNTATTLNRTDLQPHQVHARRVARETRDSRLPQPYFRFTSFWLPREEARGAARRPTIYWDDVIADTTSPLALIPLGAPSFSRHASPPTLVEILLL